MTLPKSKADRLKETIRLLKQLREMNYELTPGYGTIKTHLTQWVTDGKPLVTTVELPRQNRIAEISLPEFATAAASIHLKVVQPME
jgi:hypothetical protein